MRFIYSKIFIWFFVLVFILAFLMFLQFKGWLGPLQQTFLQAPRPIVFVAKKIAQPVQSFFATIYGLNKISKENIELQNELQKLEQEIVNLEGQKRENETLRAELGFAKTTQLELISCSVLSHNPFGLTDSIVLNCGEDAGVEEGLVILSQGFLAGKVIHVGGGSSTALLATSAQFSTDAKISKTGDSGVIRGSFGSGIILDQVPQSLEIEPGWLVATAGIDPKVPKDILIGEIDEELSSNSDLFKRATIKNQIDFNNLDFVFVVKQ